MQRRKFLIGTGSIAAGGAAVIGSGAFSQVTGQRDFALSIQPDENGEAYVNFYPTSDYAEYNDGMLKLTFGDNGFGGGINAKANTLFEGVFGITNQGTNTVDVVIPSYEEVSLSGVSQGGPPSTQFLVDESESPVSDPKGAKWEGDTVSRPGVDVVDISWPETISPVNKASNPVPIDDDLTSSGNNNVGFVNTACTGIRYPGGAARLDPGENVEIDMRFTVTNDRDAEHTFDTSFVTRAVEGPVAGEDWEI